MRPERERDCEKIVRHASKPLHSLHSRACSTRFALNHSMSAARRSLFTHTRVHITHTHTPSFPVFKIVWYTVCLFVCLFV